MPRHLRGPALIFWVFHILRDYAQRSRMRRAAGLAAAELMASAPRFEAAVGPVDVVFGHNDLLAGQFHR